MLNKVILIGRLGRDPETRFMPNGEAVCNFSVATSESWKDKNGQRQESTEWHHVTMYRKLAEIAGKYLYSHFKNHNLPDLGFNDSECRLVYVFGTD